MIMISINYIFKCRPFNIKMLIFSQLKDKAISDIVSVCYKWFTQIQY